MIKNRAVIKESAEWGQDGWMIVYLWHDQELRETKVYTEKEYARMGEEIAYWLCHVE